MRKFEFKLHLEAKRCKNERASDRRGWWCYGEIRWINKDSRVKRRAKDETKKWERKKQVRGQAKFVSETKMTIRKLLFALMDILTIRRQTIIYHLNN